MMTKYSEWTKDTGTSSTILIAQNGLGLSIESQSLPQAKNILVKSSSTNIYVKQSKERSTRKK
jgi:hypothetical protein